MLEILRVNQKFLHSNLAEINDPDQITEASSDSEFSITDYLVYLIIIGGLVAFAFFWFYLKPKHEK